MNVTTNFDAGAVAVDAPMMDPEPASVPMADTHVLRRSGAAPLAFTGVQLAMAMNYTPGAPLWYEINVFRLADGRFIADVRCFFTAEDEDDRFTVIEAQSFDQAMVALQSYDASNDVRIDFDLEDPSLSVADLTFRALALRIRVDEARRKYGSLLGQVLYDLQQPEL